MTLTPNNPATKPTTSKRAKYYTIGIDRALQSFTLSYMSFNSILEKLLSVALIVRLALVTFWGSNGLFLGLGKGPNTVLGSTQVVEQLYFST